MRHETKPNRCALCGGSQTAGTATYTADLGAGVVVVRNVPATVCDQCGEEWVDDRTSAALERLTDEARRRGTLVEVVSMS